MKISNRKLWQEIVDANPAGSYGGAAVRYAEIWAVLMEGKMSLGYELSGEVIEECSRRADGKDYDGITGFQHGAAIHILYQCWLHGPSVYAHYYLRDKTQD